MLGVQQPWAPSCCCCRALTLPPHLQELESAMAREIARKERERLKAQDKLRREQLEMMRTTQNTDAAKGEVCGPPRSGSVYP